MAQEKRGVAVVSGASSGFGRRIAQVLCRRGYSVVALARRADRLKILADEDSTGAILPVVADVRDREGLARALDELPPEFRDISVLVNNAGLSRGFGPLQSGSADSWREMIDTNISGLLNLSGLVLPRLVSRGSGHVVNIGSIAASYPYMGGNVYAATKAFVHQLSLNMRVDLQGTGVRVSCVAPGMAKTEFAKVRYDGDEECADALYRDIEPLTPDDVAEAVAWCLSQPARVNVNMIELMPVEQHFGLGFAGSPPAPPGGAEGA
ncbi:SDR family NAD(P)-dependent oxidoreductase [Streptomyces sp. ISL-44]|uniref:SDR family NAD(P)-dependent oxidoreductase n=1 Tax=unclassified Streptomyces TaxID=2593676 RepID=UPI001BE721A4|nr:MULTISPECIES: SDR family NAD(P)-dependent oxidoreductase [unclassified Streptomyces]MBT2542706.1 SDR family NAD(P)-dependent oxidoreductase [Streptomyces sp. ISL-44]UUU43340.1 SDR family NAD(P)-dependent oxidoreductase [Streptomyces sp. NBC_00162]